MPTSLKRRDMTLRKNLRSAEKNLSQFGEIESARDDLQTKRRLLRNVYAIAIAH